MQGHTKERSVEEIREETAKKLSELLNMLDIKEAYYIDDYNNIDNLPVISTLSKKLFSEDKKDEIAKIFGQDLETNQPDEDIFGESLATFWEGLDKESKKSAALALYGHDKSDSIDFDKAKELEASFPKGKLILVHPDEWDNLSKELFNTYQSSGKVLILFDKDLTNAIGDRFKNGTIKGHHLIKNAKETLKENAYCILISHLITDTSKELEERDNVIKELGDLKKKDFLALSKTRIDSPELLCDGIKKALLNGYFEEIKEKTKPIIDSANKTVEEIIDSLDTYDFDHTILRSSYEEGVWEINTLLRIRASIYEDELKKLMITEGYPKAINPFIKKSKPISDIKFEIPTGSIPYKDKFKLRHKDIYESGAEINKLHLPLENGDIFEITEGNGKGKYVLIGQDCDLMMRTKPLGERAGNVTTATLIKIQPKKAIEATENLNSGKFRLDYFVNGTTDFGIISFRDAQLFCLDALDLCVFNSEGKATLDIKANWDDDLFNIAWEKRHENLLKVFKKKAENLGKILPDLNKIQGDSLKLIKASIYPQLSFTKRLGKSENYSNNIFDFGIRRIMRLKANGAIRLIDAYHKHQSRLAEPHDFAGIE